MFRLPLLLLLSLIAAASANAALDRAAVVSAGASVLQVEAQRERGGYSLGSGVVVAANQVVTNCHVTRDAQEIRVLQGGLRWRVTAQAVDLDHDLCLLQVPGLPAPTAQLGRTADLRLAQPVTALGYTGGIGMQYSAGEVIALHNLDGGRVVRSTNWFNSGASGGGLFDDAGRLVGILTFRLRGSSGHYFAAPAEWVQALLDRAAQVGHEPVMPFDTHALPYWQKPAAAQPRFLRADAMLRSDLWGELAALAEEWLLHDAADAEAWYLLGLASDRLDRPSEARHALECSLSIEPGRRSAWTKLGVLYERLGLADAATQVRGPLVVLPGDLAPPGPVSASPSRPCVAQAS
jgi:serine protease Do